jgi:hypothetical protein
MGLRGLGQDEARRLACPQQLAVWLGPQLPEGREPRAELLQVRALAFPVRGAHAGSADPRIRADAARVAVARGCDRDLDGRRPPADAEPEPDGSADADGESGADGRRHTADGESGSNAESGADGRRHTADGESVSNAESGTEPDCSADTHAEPDDCADGESGADGGRHTDGGRPADTGDLGALTARRLPRGPRIRRCPPGPSRPLRDLPIVRAADAIWLCPASGPHRGRYRLRAAALPPSVRPADGRQERPVCGPCDGPVAGRSHA